MSIRKTGKERYIIECPSCNRQLREWKNRDPDFFQSRKDAMEYWGLEGSVTDMNIEIVCDCTGSCVGKLWKKLSENDREKLKKEHGRNMHSSSWESIMEKIRNGDI